jgi:hypothetical protein
MSSGSETRVLYAIKSDEAKAIMAQVEAVFGPQNWASYISIGNPAYNPVLKTSIITAVCGVAPGYVYSLGGTSAERKFHMDTGFMYDKIYTFAPGAEDLPALPSSAKAIAIGSNHCIAGMGGDPTVEDAWDVYFSADPDEAEQFFSLERKRGQFATFYGVTYHHSTKEVLRVKVYTYDNDIGHWDWDKALEVALESNSPA